MEETAICIVGDTGVIVRELPAPSDPESLISAFNDVTLPIARIGLEACSQATWLYQGMARVGQPALCIETRQAKWAMARAWGMGIAKRRGMAKARALSPASSP